MSERFATIVLLVEDENQAQLIRKHLVRRGHHPRSIRVEKTTAGDGIRHVLRNYAREVRNYRHQSTRVRTALVVSMDADRESVDARQRQLAAELQEPRRADERILHLIPRRHVETWLLCLNGYRVDDTGYALPRRHEVQHGSHRIPVAALNGRAADALFDWSRPNALIPDNCVPSLLTGIDELSRLHDGH